LAELVSEARGVDGLLSKMKEETKARNIAWYNARQSRQNDAFVAAAKEILHPDDLAEIWAMVTAGEPEPKE
jgi:hypothetical protein